MRLLLAMNKMTLTYLINGIRVRDQMIALTPPIISSSGGTPPDAGQIPFST
jgi:hypothetical protein